jgi:hypothetical protein
VFRIPIGYLFAVPAMAIAILGLARLLGARPKRGPADRASLPQP